MELKEQEVYANTHTVDEVREKFYNDLPIGDERGDMFPMQIGQVSASVEVDLPDEETLAKLDKLWDEKKEDERKKYHKYMKARSTDEGFEFHYLDEAEQESLKGDTMSVESFIGLIDELGKVV